MTYPVVTVPLGSLAGGASPCPGVMVHALQGVGEGENRTLISSEIAHPSSALEEVGSLHLVEHSLDPFYRWVEVRLLG